MPTKKLEIPSLSSVRRTKNDGLAKKPEPAKKRKIQEIDILKNVAYALLRRVPTKRTTHYFSIQPEFGRRTIFTQIISTMLASTVARRRIAASIRTQAFRTQSTQVDSTESPIAEDGRHENWREGIYDHDNEPK